jgi:hypothetical protein
VADVQNGGLSFNPPEETTKRSNGIAIMNRITSLLTNAEFFTAVKFTVIT